MYRYGCASGHDGNVLVLNRLCTRTRALSTPLVAEVGVEDAELRRRQHPLVEQGASAERREVGLLFDRQFVFEPLASDEHLAVELDTGRSGRVGDEQLLADRHHRPRAGAEAIGVHRHIAPAEHGQTLVDDDRLDHFLGLLGVGGVERQECHADRVRAYRRQLEAGNLAQESVGDLNQDAGTIAGVGLGAGCTSVFEIAERAKAHGHDRPARDPLQVRDERDAASVVFEPRIVETLRRGKARLSMSAHLFGSTESVYG